MPQIRHIVSKHESNAAYMAGMYGYLTGRPAVVLVTAGPGATNSISVVAQAYAASLPMVHISGDVPLNAVNEAFHGVDRTDFLDADCDHRYCWPDRPAILAAVLKAIGE